MNILFGEGLRGGIVELQAAGDIPVMKNWNRDHRLDAAAAALFRIKKKFGIDIGASENLASPKTGDAQRLVHGNVGSSGESQGPRGCPVTKFLALEYANRSAAGSGNLNQAFCDQRHCAFQLEMTNLNLVLGLDDVCQSERVIAAGGRFCFLRFRRVGCGSRTLCSLNLIPLQLEAQFHLLQFAVVLLQHISRFQQLGERLLVENWFVFFFGHDFFVHQWKPSHRTAGRSGRMRLF